MCGDFLDEEATEAASFTSHDNFDTLLERRVDRRRLREDTDGHWDRTWTGFTDADTDPRTNYFRTLESFAFKHFVGRLMDHDGDLYDALLHGPVLEHLLTLCNGDFQLARNVTHCYKSLYNLISIVVDITGELDNDGLRFDDRQRYFPDRWDKPGNGLWAL